jgi:pimeloyl-ACP methyl ester carboxylesterase
MHGTSATSMGAAVSNEYAGRVDFMEAGAGPLIVLVHSSLSGARQWSALTRGLEDRFLVRAVNLFGYGATPSWSGSEPPSLDDFAELVALAVPGTASNIHLVGHSFGGAVAMKAAARQLRGRVRSLVLIEPSLFYLLDGCGRREAFCEISALAKYTRRCIADGAPEAAAERFIDYWCGPGTWAASSPGRKSAFTRAVTLLPHEWDAVLPAKTPSAAWTAALPRHTLVISCVGTTRPASELAELLLQARPDWASTGVLDGGHMAPVTHPQLVNPIISAFMADRCPATIE